MHVSGRFTLFGVVAAAALSLAVFSSARAAPAQPAKHAYCEVGGKPLNAFVFQPAGNATAPRRAILLFHGGGGFGKLLSGRGKAKDYSPLEYVDASTPPAPIIQGAADALTPPRGAEKFCAALRAAGKVCELAVYDNVGHRPARNLKNQEDDFDRDPKASADGVERQKRFLGEHGFLPSATNTSKK